MKIERIANHKTSKGTLVPMIRGTKSEDVIKELEMSQLPKRKTVKEITLDLSPTMMRIVRSAFLMPP